MIYIGDRTRETLDALFVPAKTQKTAKKGFLLLLLLLLCTKKSQKIRVFGKDKNT